MTSALFVDTSAWLSAYKLDDPRAATSKQLLLTAPALFTTNYVIDETITLARSRVSHSLPGLNPRLYLRRRFCTNWLVC